jgi:hypothetical protein
VTARAAAGLIAVALLLAGCGGDSDEDQVRSTIETYVEAFVAGDGKRGCELMTEETRNEFVNKVAALTRTGDCARSLRVLRTLAGDATAKALEGADIEDIEIDGQTATATLVAGGNRSPSKLAKVDGKWLISAVPNAP